VSQQVKVTRQLEVGQRNIANVAKITEIDLYTVNIDPGALTVNQSVTTLFAAAQAALGDFVLIAAPADLKDVTATAYVLDTGNIEIIMHAGDNVSNLDLAAGDWKVLLIKAS